MMVVVTVRVGVDPLSLVAEAIKDANEKWNRPPTIRDVHNLVFLGLNADAESVRKALKEGSADPVDHPFSDVIDDFIVTPEGVHSASVGEALNYAVDAGIIRVNENGEIEVTDEETLLVESLIAPRDIASNIAEVVGALAGASELDVKKVVHGMLGIDEVSNLSAKFLLNLKKASKEAEKYLVP